MPDYLPSQLWATTTKGTGTFVVVLDLGWSVCLDL